MLDRLFQALEDGDAPRESGRVNARGWTCMHVAAYNLQIDCIRVIVKRVGTKSPLIHRLTSDGMKQTSVHLAVSARPVADRSDAERAILPVVGELVKLGADATALDSEFQTPEAMAKKASLTEVARVLAAVESPSSKLTRAIVAQDEGAVRAQLEDMKTTGSLPATINGKGRDGLSALHHASKIGFMQGVDLLLQFEADIADEDVERRAQPLWFAARCAHPNVANFLCRKGAQPGARAKDGSSALHGACYNGMTALAEVLLGDRNVDTAWCDGDGFTALDLACMQGNMSTVKAILIARPGCSSDSNSNSESAIFAALNCKSSSKVVDLVKLLVEEVVFEVAVEATAYAYVCVHVRVYAEDVSLSVGLCRSGLVFFVPPSLSDCADRGKPQDCDPKRVNRSGKTALDVAREQTHPNPAAIEYLQSLMRDGKGYIAEDGEEEESKPKRRPGRSVQTDPRLESSRLAAARHAAQAQEDDARAKREALELQRQEALARRDADRGRRHLRAALLEKHAVEHPVASGYRSGRLSCEVLMAKIDNTTNADGHVVSVWKDDDFFRVELEIEHLLSSTSAAASAEPVWREKVVMPVLNSTATLDVRVLLRTFRGKQVEWILVGSVALPVASLAKCADEENEEKEWVQLYAKRWASKPDLKPVGALRLKSSYVQHVPDQIAVDEEPEPGGALHLFPMAHPVPSQARPPPGPTGNTLPHARDAESGLGAPNSSRASALWIDSQEDFISAGQHLLLAGYEEDAVEDLLNVLREAKSLFRGALAMSASMASDANGHIQPGPDSRALVPTADLQIYLSKMGYICTAVSRQRLASFAQQ